MAVTRAEAITTLAAMGQPFELETITRQGIPLRVFKSAPASMRDFRATTAAFGDRDFLVYDGERTTFVEHLGIVAGLADWLASRGVGKGDRVAIGMRNYPEWVMSFWATMALGAIAVPLNAWWLGPELEYAITDSGTKVLLLDGERLERLAPPCRTSPLTSRWCAATAVTCPTGVVRWEDLRPTLDTTAACPTSPSRLTTTPRSSTRRARPARRRARWRRIATT